MGLLLVLLSIDLGTGASNGLTVKLRNQWMAGFPRTRGRQEWVINETVVHWSPENTAFVVVDMWDKHWCSSATTRSAGVTVIWAPSDCTAYYNATQPRRNTLGLKDSPVPSALPLPQPAMPLGTETDGGCDTPCKQYSAWTHQIDMLTLHPEDFLISAVEGQSEQELANVIAAKSVENLVYMGVHENMCILGRPFAIEKVRSWGFQPDRVAIIRELTDVMYTPKDPPYVSHATGLQLHTEYIEKFWASSLSMYDFLAPSY